MKIVFGKNKLSKKGLVLFFGTMFIVGYFVIGFMLNLIDLGYNNAKLSYYLDQYKTSSCPHFRNETNKEYCDMLDYTIQYIETYKKDIFK